MRKVTILIPHSEGKTSDGAYPPLMDISKETQRVLSLWSKPSKAQWGKLLGVKDKALEKAILANKNILTSKTLPAIERYSGVIYNAIDYKSLNAAAQTKFDQTVRIVSAAFGLVKPKDLIPDYKCKINNFGLDKYWRSINGNKLKDCFIIDLLPQAHKKAVEYAHGLEIEFHVTKNGKKVPAGHAGKHIKGRFIRWLVQQKTIDEKVLKEFKEDGFQWVNGRYVK